MIPAPHLLLIDDRPQARAVLSAGLEELGYAVSWLVVNRRVGSKFPRVHRVSYPRRAQLAAAAEQFAHIQQADPWIRYYGGNADHYQHYHRSIDSLLRQIKPDVVIGGAAQCYELLCIDACRELGIPYISPIAAGYPEGRFLCYRYDTFEIAGGCGYAPERDQLVEFIRRHAAGGKPPDDLAAARTGRSRPCNHGTQALAGGYYHLPNRIRILSLHRRNRQTLKQWNAACKGFPVPMPQHRKIKILFPLQRQPDPTIDVWGAPYRDQAALLQQLATAAGDQATIFVKPHPQSSCEMTPALLAAVRRHRALQPLSSEVRIQDAFAHADLVVTVTGNVALEAIFACKPCATLIASRNNTVAGCRYLSSPEKLASLLYELQSGYFLMHGWEDVIAFAERLFAESYEGTVHPPFVAAQPETVENERRLVQAFGHLIPHVLAARTLSVAAEAGMPPLSESGMPPGAAALVERKA